MTTVDVADLIRYAETETEAAAAKARAEGAQFATFRKLNENIWAQWFNFASALKVYGLEEMQRMADEDLADAKEL